MFYILKEVFMKYPDDGITNSVHVGSNFDDSNFDDLFDSATSALAAAESAGAAASSVSKKNKRKIADHSDSRKRRKPAKSAPAAASEAALSASAGPLDPSMDLLDSTTGIDPKDLGFCRVIASIAKTNPDFSMHEQKGKEKAVKPAPAASFVPAAPGPLDPSIASKAALSDSDLLDSTTGIDPEDLVFCCVIANIAEKNFDFSMHEQKGKGNAVKPVPVPAPAPALVPAPPTGDFLRMTFEQFIKAASCVQPRV
jgi:hypothetical protein